jgi:hypothetical protein
LGGSKFYSVPPGEDNVCAPNIRANNVDAFDHRPKDRRTNLGLSREADGKEGAAGTEIVNRLLVRSALYIRGLI